MIKQEESSGDELQEENASCEEDDELGEEENENKDIDNNENEKSNSYSSALTTMDWGLRSHPDYQEDYWIGDSGASSHMVGEDTDLFAKGPIQGNISTANGTSMPRCAKLR